MVSIPIHIEGGAHGSAGADPVTVAQSQVTGLTTDLAGKVAKSAYGAAL